MGCRHSVALSASSKSDAGIKSNSYLDSRTTDTEEDHLVGPLNTVLLESQENASRAEATKDVEYCIEITPPAPMARQLSPSAVSQASDRTDRTFGPAGSDLSSTETPKRRNLHSTSSDAINADVPMVANGRQVTPAFGSDMTRQISPMFGLVPSRENSKEVVKVQATMPRFVSLGDDQYFRTVGDRAMQRLVDQKYIQSYQGYKTFEDGVSKNGLGEANSVAYNEAEETIHSEIGPTKKPNSLFVLCHGCGQ